MESYQTTSNLKQRKAPIEIPPEEFRRLGHGLIDQIADFLASLPERPVTPGESPSILRQVLKTDEPLGEYGSNPEFLLKHIAELLFDHSLHNGHPRFWGYITSSAAPIGALGDLLAAAVNPNAGAWALSPAATEIEVQTVRWIAELIGYPTHGSGLLVSGGNMANFICLLVARTARAGWDVRKSGLRHSSGRQLRVYTSSETHTWIQKAADLAGLGTDAIRWIPADDEHRVNIEELRRQIAKDREQGDLPFLVVGTAGSVSTGAIDPLRELAAVCRESGAWFHVDGAYGAFAAAVPGFSSQFCGLGEADSVAVDPHKWLYAPLEAGCVLVRNPDVLRQTFSYHPPYYHFDQEVVNYFEQGPQNSRGFRALKVWLALRQVGRSGYVRMIGDDIQLAQELSRQLAKETELEVLTQSLSITTFRYVPSELKIQCGNGDTEEYLNQLNQELLGRLEKCGKLFLSNAYIGGRFALRVCIVNFRTSLEDISILPEIVCQLGREVDALLRSKTP
jgi:aromatic-L-amino-acid/L-tryptophan decarboxylase